MTNLRPICPIPPDARVGDVVRNKDGSMPRSGCSAYPYAIVISDNPFAVASIGGDTLWTSTVNAAQFEVVGVANGKELAGAMQRVKDIQGYTKPKRTQAQMDAAYIRYVLREVEKREVMGLVIHISQQKIKRMLAIADRMEGKT